MDESNRQDEGDSPHIHFQTDAKPQHYQGDQKEQQQQQSYVPEQHKGQSQYRRSSAGDLSTDDVGTGEGGKSSSSQSTPPPNLSSATTTATTPTSTATSSTAEHGHLSSPPQSLLRPTAGKSDPANPSGSPPAPAASSDIDTSASTAQTYSTAPSTDVPSGDPSSRVASAQAAHPSSSSVVPRPMQSPSSSSALLVSIKLLVSNNVAGSIIGRSGQTISDLQVQSSSRIKLSQSGDFYPGTSDRVCLVQGDVTQVKLAAGMVLQKIYDLQRNAQHVQAHPLKGSGQRHSSAVSQGPAGSEASASTLTRTEYDAQQPPQQSFVVRVLVPTPFCGMLIGRGGSNIKSMAESSGVTSIRLSPKESEGGPAGAGAGAIVAATSERIVTVTGTDLASTVSCIGLIVDGMASHPEIGRYANMTTSYSRASSAVSAAAALQGLGSGLQGPQTGFGLGAPVSAPSSSVAPFAGAELMGAAAAAAAAGGFVLSPPSPSLGLPSQQHQRRAETSPLPSEADQLAHPNAIQSSPHLHQSQQMMGMSSTTQAIAGPSSQQLRYTPFSGGDDGTLMQPPPPPPPSPQVIPASPVVSLPNMQLGGQGGAYNQASLSQQSQQSIFVVAPQSSSSAIQSMYSQAAPTGAPAGRRSSRPASRRSSQESITADSAAALSSTTDQFASVQLSGSMASSTSDDGRYSQGQPGMAPSQGQAQAASMQIAVPDTMIGAILGRGGQTLTELQMSSNTRIKISQRGVFVPGTNHRVVTVSGPTAESVSMAHYLIGQRLARSGLRIGSVDQHAAVGSTGTDQLQHTGLHPAPPRKDSREYAQGSHQYHQEQRGGTHQQDHHRQSNTEGATGAPPDRGKSRR